MQYKFPKNPRQLEAAEQMILGATRLWVCKTVELEDALQPVAHYYAKFGVVGAAHSHAAILHNSATAASRKITINCLCASELTLDESRIVHAIAHAQAGRPDAAIKCLASWLPDAVLRLTEPSLNALADAFTVNNFTVPIRPWSCAPDFSDVLHGDTSYLLKSTLAH